LPTRGLRTESEEPHGILDFRFDEAPPFAPRREKVSEAELAGAIRDFLEKLAWADYFPPR
jgi:hypothetical protein